MEQTDMETIDWLLGKKEGWPCIKTLADKINEFSNRENDLIRNEESYKEYVKSGIGFSIIISLLLGIISVYIRIFLIKPVT